jgi:hypothetical protein
VEDAETQRSLGGSTQRRSARSAKRTQRLPGIRRKGREARAAGVMDQPHVERSGTWFDGAPPILSRVVAEENITAEAAEILGCNAKAAESEGIQEFDR